MNKKALLRQTAAAIVLSLGTVLCNAEEIFLDRIVAIVGDNVVMKSELDSRVKDVTRDLQRRGTAAPPKEKLMALVLERLVSERLRLNLAENRNIQVTDGEINQALQRLASNQKLSLEQFINGVHQQGENVQDLRRNIHNELLLQRIDDLFVMGNIKIGLQELQQFWASEEAQASSAPEFQLSYILLPLSSGASKKDIEATTEKAQRLIQELANGADFHQLAIANSVADNALQGGDLGWKRTVSLPSKWVSSVNELQPGDVSEPIRTDAGLNIIKVYDRRGGQQQILLKQYHVRHILLKTNALRDDEAAYNDLLKARQRLIDGEDFAALAKKISDDPSNKHSGGDLGWVTIEEGQLVPEFLQMVGSVGVNEVSYPFRTEYGFHILEVTEHREKDFSDIAMQNQAHKLLRERRFEEEKSIFLQELRDNNYIELKKL